MSDAVPRNSWLPSFRRALRYLRPHRRPLIIGLLAALGVSIFYTFGVSSVVPLLKVVFSEHETLADWIHRVETERRLGATLAPDLPDQPSGLQIDFVRPDSPSRGLLRDRDRIVSLAGQPPPGSYALMKFIAEHADESLDVVVTDSYDGQRREVRLTLRPYHVGSALLARIASLLPGGKDSDSRLHTLALVMGGLVLVSLIGAAFRVLNEGLIALAVQRSMHDLRSRLAAQVLHLPLDWHSAHPHGDTLGRFATDLSKVEIGLTTLIGKTIREPLKAVGVFALTLLIDWKLLAVALLALPIGAIVMQVFGRVIKRAQKRASQSWGRLLDHLGEKLAGIRIVKAYGMQDAESDRFEREGRTLTRAQTHIELVDAATNPALETVALIAVALFVLYGGSRVFSHELEPHLFFAAIICLGGIFDPVRKMGNVMNRLQAAEVSATRLFELMDLPTEMPLSRPPAAPPVELPPFRESIEFRDLSFHYPAAPGRFVLDRVNLSVRKGSVVALVGPNGSGKTTLISLLMRFYEPAAGAILIDGVNIADVSLDSLRRQIGLVTQDAVVFSDTVRNNIAYGANGVTDDVVRRAAQLAHVDDFIQSLRAADNGQPRAAYDVTINARALSGGQRQRIALARAILRDPPILVLDEATSQIDSESERRIQEAIEDVTRNRTTFIIAHRFSTIARADLTVVLNDGRIVATGRHADLVTTCPFYAALCQTQFAQT
jgi:ABC-type multidrug transport system fused ATPase/permease subunit